MQFDPHLVQKFTPYLVKRYLAEIQNNYSFGTLGHIYEHLKNVNCIEKPNVIPPILTMAYTFARGVHFGQFRHHERLTVCGAGAEVNKYPYIYHPMQVWLFVYIAGGDFNQQAAALLHDVGEYWPKNVSFAIDQDEALNLLNVAFDRDISNMVKGCTNPEYLTKQTQHAWQVQNIAEQEPRTQLVKICDHIVNLYDLCRKPADGGNQKRAEIICNATELMMACDEEVRENAYLTTFMAGAITTVEKHWQKG